MQVRSGDTSGTVTDDSATFRLDNLESEVVGGACCLSPSTPFVPSNLPSIYVFQLEMYFCMDWAKGDSWFFSQQHPQLFPCFLLVQISYGAPSASIQRAPSPCSRNNATKDCLKNGCNMFPQTFGSYQ